MLKCYTISVTTPGTPQNILAAIQALSSGAKVGQLTGQLSGALDLRIRGIAFQADPANTASKNVYIGSSDINVASKIGIGMALGPGVLSTWINVDNTASLAELWFDIDTAATTKNLLILLEA
jgi:hypothetical protein